MNYRAKVAFIIKGITLVTLSCISLSTNAQTDTSYLSLERFLNHKIWIDDDCTLDTCTPHYIKGGRFFEGGRVKGEMCFHWGDILFIADPVTGEERMIITSCKPLICVSHSEIKKGKRIYYVENTSEAGIYKNKIVIQSDSSFTMEGPHGMPWIKKNKLGYKITNKIPAEARYLFTEYLKE